MTNTGIVVVDMQQNFLDRVFEPHELVQAQQEVLEEMAGKLPVILLEYNGCGSTIGEIAKYASLPPITKHKNDGFMWTPLDSTLREHDVQNVLLMGIYMGACVRATAMSALRAGFSVMTAATLLSDPARYLDLQDPFYLHETIYASHHNTILDLLSS